MFTPAVSPPGIGLGSVTQLTTGMRSVYLLYSYASATGSFGAALPPGMTFDSSTGVFAGTPTTVGTYTTPVTVTNANGTTTATLTFVVTNPPVPQLTDTAARAVTTGTAFSSAFYVLNLPSSVTITGLPPGLSYTYSQPSYPDGYTAGTISGTPTTPGTYRAAVMAANAGGSVSGTMTFVVNPVSNAPVFQAGTAEERILPVGTSFSESFATSPAATNYAASGLPPD